MAFITECQELAILPSGSYFVGLSANEAEIKNYYSAEEKLLAVSVFSSGSRKPAEH